MDLKAPMLMVIALVLVGAAADDALDGCLKACGDVPIIYPFGVGNSNTTGESCFLQKHFNVNCNSSTLYSGTVQVSNINISTGQLDFMFDVSQDCYDSRYVDEITSGNSPTLTSSRVFTISSKENKFINIGCDSYGYLNSVYNDEYYSTGCFSICYNKSRDITDGKCSGLGCCQVDIPPGMNNISVQAFSFLNFNRTLSYSNCSYSFVAKNGNYTYSANHLLSFPFENVPMVVDWAVGDETCEASGKRGTNACKSNSRCVDSDTGYGYRCYCEKGYEGNPYHPHGCRDIDECMTQSHKCTSDHNCRNTNGSYECFCLEGQYGKGTKEAGGCQQIRRENPLSKIAIGTGVGLMALILATSWVYILYQKRNLTKLKEKFFRQNGGIILQQKLSGREDSSRIAQIFTSKQLEQATNNYDARLIIGKGGYGTVFKGVLTDNRIVAVKKSKGVDQNQVEQFINEVVVLSQINHRNIVKLLGCCLETEVPSLVYEFVNNGTLFDYLHKERKVADVSWKTRLRIAAEAARALSYLHSAASIPIIHRDIKSANILLDDTYTTKVSDFGASRLVPLDQTEVATMVQGTIGYLDPEYLQTSQLTEKSDVYSFGVVLVELLTGEIAFSCERPEEKRSLALHFLSCLREDLLFDVLDTDILNDENKDEIKEVAILAANCLRLNGEERPSMKEVEMELEAITQKDKHPWTSTNQNHEETQYLLHEASSVFEHGDSNNHQNTGYDSLKDHILIGLDDGR